jgi:ubiquitin C-terminal hydrolase
LHELQELAEGSSYSCPECRKHQSLSKKPKIAEKYVSTPLVFLRMKRFHVIGMESIL